MLALSAVVNPGDEVVGFDPYFVMYKHLTTLCGGRFVDSSTPTRTFASTSTKVRAAITTEHEGDPCAIAPRTRPGR